VIHLTVQQISSYFDGELNPSSAELVRQHLASCKTCAAGYAELEAQGRALDRALASDPGEEFFTRLAERVESQIGAGPAGPAARPAPAARAPQTERPTVPPRGEPPRTAVAPPPRAAVPSRPAPVAARPASVPPSPAEPARPSAEEAAPVEAKMEAAPRAVVPPTPPHRLSGRPDRAPFPWAVAAVITVLAVSTGVVLSGAGRGLLRMERNGAPAGGVAAIPLTASPVPEASPPVQPPDAGPGVAATEAPAPTGPAASPDHATPTRTPPRTTREETVETDATTGAPGDGDETAAETTDSGSSDFEPVPIPAEEALVGLPGRGASAKATAGGTPSPSVRPAPPASAVRADSSPPRPPRTAADFDAVASRLERQLDQLRGDEYREARYRLAEARFRAWSLAPNGDRAARTEAAVRAFLVTAREGPERDNASGWLSAVEEAGFR
jgi:hypothetical protein